MTQTAPPPLLSVVVAARRGDEALSATLASVADQPQIADVELVVVDTSDGGLPLPDAGATEVQRLHRPGADLPTAKAAGLDAASGDLVAILDPGTLAPADWLEKLVSCFDDPAAVAAAGAVTYGGSGGTWDLGCWLFEYGAFAPPLEGGVTEGDLPGNHVAYRRSALLESCGEELRRDGFFKPFCHDSLRARGGRLVLQPAIEVRLHSRRGFAEAVGKRFWWGRCFAARRLQRADAGWRWRYRLGVPLVPALLLARHLRRCLTAARLRRWLPRGLPGLAAVALAWGLGEWAGAWLGEGDWRRASW